MKTGFSHLLNFDFLTWFDVNSFYFLLRQTRKDITSKKDGSTGGRRRKNSYPAHRVVVSQVLGKARVRVDGMTCGLCVHLIQAKVKEMKGVVDILVSLENSEAMVTFDCGVLDSAKIAHAVDQVDSKFKASLVAEIVDISVEGMTCQSCVKVITAKLQEVEGVMQAEVKLLTVIEPSD